MTATATVRRSKPKSHRSSNRKSHRPRTRQSRQAVRSRRRRKASVFIVLALVLALLGTSLWGLYFSTALVTKRVNVVGTHNLTRTQVSLAAQVPLGVPLVRQDLDAIAARTATLPAVESAAVTRDWPSTITVTVVERRPVLAVRQSSGYVVVDKYGIAYQTQPVLPPEVLLAEVNAGDVPLLSEVAIVAAALPHKLRVKVDRITAGSRDGISLLLTSGRMVTWGSSSDSELKAQVTGALLKQKPKSFIDVSSPHNPTIR
jgi:cell division protein FtsQ